MLFCGGCSEAHVSYHRVPGMLKFAKTRWLVDVVSAAQNATVFKMSASVDLGEWRPDAPGCSLFGPHGARPVHVLAMIRPLTRRRNPAGTLRAMLALQARHGAAVALHFFGCSRADFGDVVREAFNGTVAAEELEGLYAHHGSLTRRQMVRLVAGMDVFVDMSAWQAFGRTGLEAMAAGCVPVMPDSGGASEFARNGSNAWLTDAAAGFTALDAASALVANPAQLCAMRAQGLADARKYFGMETAAGNLFALLKERHANHSRAYVDYADAEPRLTPVPLVDSWNVTLQTLERLSPSLLAMLPEL